MVVSGIPQRNGDSHTREIAGMALSFMESIDCFTVRHKPAVKLKLRLHNSDFWTDSPMIIFKI